MLDRPPSPPRPPRAASSCGRGCARFRQASSAIASKAGATSSSIEPGDRITVTDVEGGQPCELIAFGEDGRADRGVIGASEGGGLAVRAADPALGEASPLKRRGIDRAVRRRSVSSRPRRRGTSQEFRASGRATSSSRRPARRCARTQDTATPIELRIERARRARRRTRSFSPSRSPIRCRTSASTGRRRRPMSCAPANTSRSSTSPAASAPTSSAFPRASSTRAASCRSTRRRRAA